MVKIKPTTKLSREKSGRIVKTDPFLRTGKNHKKWYKPENLGKQRQKPKQKIKQ